MTNGEICQIFVAIRLSLCLSRHLSAPGVSSNCGARKINRDMSPQFLFGLSFWSFYMSYHIMAQIIL